MKKALLALSAVALSASALAQGTGGTLLFRTLQIQNAAGTANYNVPIYASSKDNLQTVNGQQVYVANENSTAGAGTLPGGTRIGLFTAGSTTPFFTSVLGTTAAQSAFAVNPATATIAVPGSQPGQTVPLTIRAWSGAGDYAAAQATVGGNWREWTFTTRPLGGDTGTGTPTTPPTMTGWGPENGTGYELNETAVPEPSTIALGILGVGALALARRRK
jgi:hypothetical protein